MSRERASVTASPHSRNPSPLPPISGPAVALFAYHGTWSSNLGAAGGERLDDSAHVVANHAETRHLEQRHDPERKRERERLKRKKLFLSARARERERERERNQAVVTFLGLYLVGELRVYFVVDVAAGGGCPAELLEAPIAF